MKRHLLVMAVVFVRIEGGHREDGVIINEGSGPIIDMDGEVVPYPVQQYWLYPSNGTLVLRNG
jgi:hypothetical protein